MEKKESQGKILIPDLQRMLRANKTKIATEFGEKFLKILDEPFMEVSFGMPRSKVEELNEVVVFKDRFRCRV